jgi:PD-(D/E)XK endonuclease
VNQRTSRLQGCKIRGEWAELCFMARAAQEGLLVSKPWGDSARYDVGVEFAGRHLRVQVKSTQYQRRGNSYSLNVMGPRRNPYNDGEIDFVAVYLIPIDEWNIIPFPRMQTRSGTLYSLHFTIGSKRQKYAPYREAWHLLREK